MSCRKIVVAMSGGVDSSVAAALLHNDGHEVIGITLKLYDYGEAQIKKGACCAGQDIYDAERAAEQIGISHYVLNYESIFKKEVIDEFADSYLRGETPIPCVRCNQSVKFRDLIKIARDLGADALATGHYVRKDYINNKAAMYIGSDPAKDQSYFLFATTQEQLDYLLFPVGNLHKSDTRKIAKDIGLELSDKPDSQDICFVAGGQYAEFISKIRPGALDPGDIVDTEDTVLGRHNGIINFTVGQRRGIGISSTEPMYVIKLDPVKNTVTVGPKSALASKLVHLHDLNWLGEIEPIVGNEIQCQARLRSMSQNVECTVCFDVENRAKVLLQSDYFGATPGQACVLYDGERVLGGGWITRHG